LIKSKIYPVSLIRSLLTDTVKIALLQMMSLNPLAASPKLILSAKEKEF